MLIQWDKEVIHMAINQINAILIFIYRVGKLLIKAIKLSFHFFIIRISDQLNLKKLYCLVEFSFILFLLIMFIPSRRFTMDKIQLIEYLIVQILVKFLCKFMKNHLIRLINNLLHGIYYQQFYNKMIIILVIFLFQKLLKIFFIAVLKIIKIFII